MSKRYGIWLALIVGTWAAIVVLWATASPHQRPIDSMTACYIALSQDLAPLLDPRVTDMAAASPECASPSDYQGTLDSRARWGGVQNEVARNGADRAAMPIVDQGSPVR